MWAGYLGHITTATHLAELHPPSTRRIHSVAYQAGRKARDFVKNETENMLLMKVLEHTQTEWISPVALTPNKDGILRFCIFYRKFNLVTLRCSYQLPWTDGFIDSLGNAERFSTLHAKSDYWQIGLVKTDRETAALALHYGLRQLTRMPFSSMNVPAIFPNVMDITLCRFKSKFTLEYFDDMVIVCKTPQENILHANMDLNLLLEADVTLKLNK